MSIEVQHFLNDSGGNFTETAPRPPVPGEECELQSNGGTSTRSSGSHKSHLSGKSHSSGKSGVSHQSDYSHSPAAGTPRRSNLDKTGGSLTCLDSEDVEAPLGFEPEGSATNSPPFTENSTPPYLKWAENLNFLLEDSDGVKLFRQFLEQEQCSSMLEFLFACKGLKIQVPSDDKKIESLAKLIYKKYIKGERLSLKPEIRKDIADKLARKEGMDQSIFDEAQADVENSIRDDTYPLFLKSDLYLKYIQNGGDSPKTSNTSSGSNSARPLSGPLPTLHEGEELKQEDFVKPQTLTLTRTTLLATSASRANCVSSKHKRQEGVYHTVSHHQTHSGKLVSPYHVSYTTVSAQDSELQSLSSDALTDDTMSLTDSSVDGAPAAYNRKHWKQQRRAMQRSANQNRDTSLNQQFIPRTERAPKDRNIAETDPSKFAAMLMERLEKVYQDQEKTERIGKILEMSDCLTDDDNKLQVTQISQNTSMIFQHGKPVTPSQSSTTLPLEPALMEAAAMAEVDRDESAQSILEEHCSRIWDSSAGQTPSRSPGRHSPKCRSPDRTHRRTTIAGPVANLSGPVHKHHHKRNRDKEYLSISSFDSGVGEEKSHGYDSDVHHKHIHHYHHHHHVGKDAKNKQDLELEAQQRGISALYFMREQMSRGGHFSQTAGSALPEPTRGRARDTKRGNGKKGSDSSSNIDSGVSLYEGPHPLSVPNLQDPNNEKVLAWMLENEKISSGTTNYSTDSSDKSSHKRSHKSSLSATASPSQHRQSTGSKKPVQYNASRSGSLDRSGLHSFVAAEFAHPVPTMPRQPIVQDPMMPLLTPPNITTQLEEAKRKLEDETKARMSNSMSKSRSFTVTSSKNQLMPPPFTPPRSLPNKAIPTASSQDLPEENLGNTPMPRLDKRQPRRPSSSAPTTPACGEVTVVGYYFCGEPIPYRSTIPGRNVTLAQFKQLVTKKGNYKYFFKKASDEFDSGVVNEEVTDDNAILPLWEGKIVGKVEKME